MQRTVLRTVQKFAPAARASAGANSSVFAAAMAAAAASGAYYCASNPTNTERLSNMFFTNFFFQFNLRFDL